MNYFIVILSLFFIIIGFIVTPGNARYILAGYNTLPDEDKEKVDIRSYIKLFRRIHLILGLGYISIGLFLLYFGLEWYLTLFMVLYPILAYIVLLWMANKYFSEVNKNLNKAGIILLSCILIFILVILILNR